MDQEADRRAPHCTSGPGRRCVRQWTGTVSLTGSTSTPGVSFVSEGPGCLAVTAVDYVVADAVEHVPGVVGGEDFREDKYGDGLMLRYVPLPVRQGGKSTDEAGIRVTQDLDFLRGRRANKYESVLMDDGMLGHLNESSVKAYFDMRVPSTMVRVRYNAAAFCGG
eukprot:1359660-Amphidinium_carterae.3